MGFLRVLALSSALFVCLTAPLKAVLDENGNGVSDVWELIYYGYDLNAFEVASDDDGDGHAAFTESLFGTDPLNNHSVLRVALPVLSPATAEFSFQSVSGIAYQPQSSVDLLLGFTSIGTVMHGSGGTLTTTVSLNGATDLFFRLEGVSGRNNQDGDPLDAYEEALFGSNDSTQNSDTDQASDIEEFRLRKAGINVDPSKDFTVPGVRDGEGDADGDGVPDLTELRDGTDPSDSVSYPATHPSLDTDKDGLRDAWEIQWFGNITAQSAEDNFDGDRLTNRQEQKLGSNPNLQKTGGTYEDGLDDQDEDSAIDLWELEDGTNPFVSDANFNSKNFIMLQGVMEHRNTWGPVGDIVVFQGTVMRATAIGFEDARVVPTTRKRFAVKNEVPASFTSSAGNWTASEFLYFRKGVKYQIEITNTTGNPNVPFISGKFQWTTTGNADELDNRSIAYEVVGKQWYVTDPADTVSPIVTVRADPNITPNPDPNNTQFTYKASGSGGPDPVTNPTGTLTVSPVDFVFTRPGSPAALTTILRDEIVDLQLTKNTASPADLLVNIDIIPDTMRTQEIPTRGAVQMYDFGTVAGAVVTPGITQVTLPQVAGGNVTIKAVFNREGTLRVRVRRTDGTLVAESQEITVQRQIRKYGALAPSTHDFNQYDQHFIDSAAYWQPVYNHAVDDVERLKAIGMTESELGRLPQNPGLRPDDIMTIGHPDDHVLDTLRAVAGHREFEVVPATNSIRTLNYPEANHTPASIAIRYGTCWLYHKAQTITPQSTPGPWRIWDTATQRYNGGGVRNYLQRVTRAFRQGRHPTDNAFVWPIRTDTRPRP